MKIRFPFPARFRPQTRHLARGCFPTGAASTRAQRAQTRAIIPCKQSSVIGSRRGCKFDSSYTFAKALADNQGPANNSGFAGENGGYRATSILDRYVDFGNVYGTRRNRWNSTMVYDLPVGRGKQFGSNHVRFADLAIGGWRLANIFLWQSGSV